MADTLAFGATAPASLSNAAPTRWEVRQAVRLGQAADIKIYPQGARASAGALATVHVRCGFEVKAEALARLIAAAPELRDALSGLVYLLDLANEVWGSHGPTLTPEQITAARALLARLEGGAA